MPLLSRKVQSATIAEEPDMEDSINSNAEELVCIAVNEGLDVDMPDIEEEKKNEGKRKISEVEETDDSNEASRKKAKLDDAIEKDSEEIWEKKSNSITKCCMCANGFIPLASSSKSENENDSPPLAYCVTCTYILSIPVTQLKKDYKLVGAFLSLSKAQQMQRNDILEDLTRRYFPSLPNPPANQTSPTSSESGDDFCLSYVGHQAVYDISETREEKLVKAVVKGYSFISKKCTIEFEENKDVKVKEMEVPITDSRLKIGYSVKCVKVKSFPAWPALLYKNPAAARGDSVFCIFYNHKSHEYATQSQITPFCGKPIKGDSVHLKKARAMACEEQAKIQTSFQFAKRMYFDTIQNSLSGEKWINRQVRYQDKLGKMIVGKIVKFLVPSKYLIKYVDNENKEQFTWVKHVFNNDYKDGLSNNVILEIVCESDLLQGSANEEIFSHSLPSLCIKCSLPAKETKEEGKEVEAKEGEQKVALTLCCSSCEGIYHSDCLDENVQGKVKGSLWRCLDCLLCDSCHVRHPDGDNGGEWNKMTLNANELYLCLKCFNAFEKKEYCSGCMKRWYNSDKNMVQCDDCDFWVHGVCDGLEERDIYLLGTGKHPRWGKHYSCPSCRKENIFKVIEGLVASDRLGMFLEPVTVEQAPEYFDSIKYPMDLQTIKNKARKGKYNGSYQLFRLDFDLMVLNAVTFNPERTKLWKEAYTFYNKGVKIIKDQLKGTNNLSVHAVRIEQIKQEWSLGSIKVKEEKRVKSSNNFMNILPKFKSLRALTTLPVRHFSVPRNIYLLEHNDCQEVCFACSSSGPESNFIFCYDCGEAFHYFCAGLTLPPNDEMKKHWRCVSCKVCEVCQVENPAFKEMLMCENCDRPVHTLCLKPRLTAALPVYVCGRCVQCKYCNIKQDVEGYSSKTDACMKCISSRDGTIDNEYQTHLITRDLITSIQMERVENLITSQEEAYLDKDSVILVENEANLTDDGKMEKKEENFTSPTTSKTKEKTKIIKRKMKPDERSCDFCLGHGDSEVCERLLPYNSSLSGSMLPLTSYVHLNCALWSSEVFEDLNGYLNNVQKALSRKVIKCTHCNCRGATIGCCAANCKESFHFECLIAHEGVMLENKQTYCQKHAKSISDRVPRLQSYKANRFVGILEESDINNNNSKIDNKSSNCSKEDKGAVHKDAKLRMGSLSVQVYGDPVAYPVHHSSSYLHPHSYKATRRYPSCLTFGERETYTLEILYEEMEHKNGAITTLPSFCISIKDYGNTITEDDDNNNNNNDNDNYDNKDTQDSNCNENNAKSQNAVKTLVVAKARSSDEAFKQLRNKIVALHSEKNSVLRIKERRAWNTFGATSSHFFGFGLKQVIDKIELLPSVLKSIFYKHEDEELEKMYKFVYSFYLHLPSDVALRRTVKEMEESKLKKEIPSITGSARTDGRRMMTKVDRSKAFLYASPHGMKITKSEAKPPKSKLFDEEANSGMSMRHVNPNVNFLHLEGSNCDFFSIGAKFKAMKRKPLEELVIVRRSPIHGWGLFALQDIEAGEMVIEYVGEAVRQKIADIRENFYNESGTTSHLLGGGCYLFRISDNVITDATRKGSIARFINHSCQPNSNSAIITVNGKGHIVIYAKHRIKRFAEITYDYKFPIEDDEALKCYCGAENCIGRMN